MFHAFPNGIYKIVIPIKHAENILYSVYYRFICLIMNKE